MKRKDPLPPRFTDRFRVPDDFKKLSLEVVEEPRDPPLVGIFDLPVRCYVVNEEWDKHISGAVSVLTEWRAWNGDEDDRDTSVQAVLEFLAQDGDCSMTQLQVRQNSTDPCKLEYSINGGIDWVEFADILQCVTQDFIEQSMLTGFATNQGLIDIITDIAENADDNSLPDTPTSGEPDLLCDAAYYMTDQIIQFIDDTLTDAATITLEEFITALLGLGGFDGSLLVLFWNLIVANSYPDLLTDVQASRDEVAEILYCNELDKESTTTEIDASATIGTEAQAALIGAINAITDGKWSLWAFVGSQIDSGEDCTSLCAPPSPALVTFDEFNWQDYTVLEGTLDNSFGNPLPSAQDAYNANIDTSRTRVRVDLLANRFVTDVSFDGWCNQTNWTMLVFFLNSELGLITSTSDPGLTLLSSWRTLTRTGLTVPNVRYVDFFVGLSGSSAQIWSDNLNVEWD